MMKGSQVTSKNKKFLFIVGMPRSGTKLIREILNNHDEIFLTDIETEFLPYMIKLSKKLGDLSQKEKFKKFYDEITQTGYFMHIRREGNCIDVNTWFSNCESYDIQNIFAALIKYDVNIPENKKVILGDKSPSYIRYLPVLKKYFPKSKFIHIIRDVRDYCLSINKAWGKNILRAAQRWNDDVNYCSEEGRKLNGDYHEIFYEKLIDTPKTEIIRVCDFLEVNYDEKLLIFTRNIESVGDARNKIQIISSNKNKFLKKMSSSQLKQVESIAGKTLRKFNYKLINSNINFRKLSKLTLFLFKIQDGINLLLNSNNINFRNKLIFHTKHALMFFKSK